MLNTIDRYCNTSKAWNKPCILLNFIFCTEIQIFRNTAWLLLVFAVLSGNGLIQIFLNNYSVHLFLDFFSLNSLSKVLSKIWKILNVPLLSDFLTLFAFQNHMAVRQLLFYLFWSVLLIEGELDILVVPWGCRKWIFWLDSELSLDLNLVSIYALFLI